MVPSWAGFPGASSLSCESAGVAGIDVHDVARRLGGTLGSEECHGLGHILRINAALEQAALAVDSLEIVDAGLVLRSALCRPFALPDARTAQYGVRVDHVHANRMRRAFQREATRQVQLRGLGGAVRGGARRGGEGVLRADENDGTADSLRLEQL